MNIRSRFFSKLKYTHTSPFARFAIELCSLDKLFQGEMLIQCRIERIVTRQHDEQQAAKAPNVRTQVILLILFLLQNFWWNVEIRSELCRQTVIDTLAETEIANLCDRQSSHDSITRKNFELQEDILGFDITVSDLTLVDETKSYAHLIKKQLCFFFAQPSLSTGRDVRKQVRLAEFHQEEVVVDLFDDIEEPDDVFVSFFAEFVHVLNFIFEMLQHLVVILFALVESANFADRLHDESDVGFGEGS